ncbi:MAG: hypothetical protein NT062_34405 [Proteobacteria bacterium]|nr:hypothetical protein [Pseudomonadota bacterium]
MSRLWIGLALASTIASPSLAAPKEDRKRPPEVEPEPEPEPTADPTPISAPDKPVPAPIVDTPAPVAPPPTSKAAPSFQWEPFGFLRMQYRLVQNDPNVIFIGRDDGFELQNAQLRVGLRDAYVDAGLGGHALVRGGFFQPWADPEAQIADTDRELVDKQIESRGVRVTEGFQQAGLTPGRSIGAAFRYDPSAFAGHDRAPGRPALAFELALQNGADEFASSNDNDKPAISASALARFGTEGFLVGSVRYNPRTVNEIPALQDEDDLSVSAGVHAAGGPVSFGAAGIFTRTTYATTAGPANTALGGHAQVMFRVPGAYPLAIGYRFGILDPSSLIITDRVMEHTAGAVIGVPRLRMRVQLQVTHVVEQAARALDNSRAQVGVEVAL